MSEDLYILGAGGHGREVHSYIRDLKRAGWNGELAGFLDDAAEPGDATGYRILGKLEFLDLVTACEGASPKYITAFGDNLVRAKVVARVEPRYSSALTAFTLVHPTAYVGEKAEVLEGTCLAPGSLVNARSKIGRHCILNVKASVSHDCEVGDFVNINPAATVCGWVTIGEGAFIGAGATIKDRVHIGAWSTVGAGATVIRDVPADVTVVGIPARAVGMSQRLCQTPIRS